MVDITEDAEQANFVILTLLRKLYVQLNTAQNAEKEQYQLFIRQLQKDLKHLHQPAVQKKVEQIYIPYLQQLNQEEANEI